MSAIIAHVHLQCTYRKYIMCFILFILNTGVLPNANMCEVNITVSFAVWWFEKHARKIGG